MQIIANTPLWVWPLLALLIWIGMSQMQERTYSRSRALILPIVMIALSIIGTVSIFGLRPDAFVAWLIGVGAVIGINHALFKWPRDVRAAGADIRVPGSVVPLIAILCIFCLRFITGVTMAVRPTMAAEPVFVASVCAILGGCAGLFIARTIKMMSAAVLRGDATA